MIQPIDIQTKKFKKGLFGYKPGEVDEFVLSTFRAYEEIFNENKKLKDSNTKLNAVVEESRLKIFDLENQIQKGENATDMDGGTEAAKLKADEIIRNAEAQAAKIISNAKAQSETIESGAASVKPEPKAAPKAAPKAEEPKASASSRFFKKAEEPKVAVVDDDDDEIFVGEIEESRKPDRMMIGDGDEETEDDFEFL